MGLIYKVARTNEEFEKIHLLNYKTFVEEIPQHTSNETKRRIDPFHKENTYLICLKDEQLVGMIAVRGKRPFSLDKKIGNIEKHLSLKINKPCEIRLLAVDKDHRNGKVFFGLSQLLARYCLREGFDIAVISGTTREEKLYLQMGFQPFANKIGTVEALYQPMYLTKETFDASLAGRLYVAPKSFLPGPLKIEDSIRLGFNSPPISHRSKQFVHQMTNVKDMLCKMTNAKDVQVFLGTGTLANDVIAGQLSQLNGKGLILVNGEFSSRLLDHASRAGLYYSVIEKEWGEVITKEDIEAKLKTERYTWLWTVHCETSTGMLNDVRTLTKLCSTYDVKLCLDSISSIGTVPLQLKDVYLASGVSGKAIGSYTGLSFVFHNYKPQPSKSLPRYLDLGMYESLNGIPYSQSSNLLNALEKALEKFTLDDPYKLIRSRYESIKNKLSKFGLSTVTDAAFSSPAILTIAIPKHISVQNLGDDLYLLGFHLHYQSMYLQQRNWIQISTMGPQKEKDIERMLLSLNDLLQTYHVNELIK